MTSHKKRVKFRLESDKSNETKSHPNDIIYHALSEAFNNPKWTGRSRVIYQIMKQYVQNHTLRYYQHDLSYARSIITKNIGFQPWYQASRNRANINRLLQSIVLINHVSDVSDYAINFGLSLRLSYEKSFELHISYYYNKINRSTNYLICVQNAGQEKAYLAYYTAFLGGSPSSSALKLKLPELDKIYRIAHLVATEIGQLEFVCLVAEIVMYYDNSQTICQQPIGFTVGTTLQKFVDQYNSYSQSQRS